MRIVKQIMSFGVAKEKHIFSQIYIHRHLRPFNVVCYRWIWISYEYCDRFEL